MTDEELIVILKNRVKTLELYHAKLINALNITNTEHPDYLKQPVDLGTIQEKLGNIPNTRKSLETYIKTASSIYLVSLNQYENLKDNHREYVDEKRFLYL